MAECEQLVDLYQRVYGMEVLAFRLGMFVPCDFFHYGMRLLHGGVDERDLAQAFRLGLESTEVRSGTFNLFSPVPFEAEDEVERFLMRFTRKEIHAVSRARRMLIAPIATVDDVAHDEQLASRDFFRTVKHPTLDREITLPGAFAKFSQTPALDPRPAPTLGQHNQEVLGALAARVDA